MITPSAPTRRLMISISLENKPQNGGGATDGDYRPLDEVLIYDENANSIIENCNKESLNSQIQEWFLQEYKAEKDSLAIRKLDNQKSFNQDNHYIVTCGDKEYHVKPAMHGAGNTLGSKFNEMAFYKLNEILKIGSISNGFVTKEGILMICTEDLKFRSLGKAPNKTISFEDNRLSQGIKRDIVDNIPIREKDNVHRCVSEIAINLLFYSDVRANYGNTGFKVTRKVIDEGGIELKEKPFIIDFKLASREDLDRKFRTHYSILCEVDKVKEFAEIIANYLYDDSEKKEIPINIFKFQQDPQIIKEALKKLFLTENGDINKFDKAIADAFEFTTSLARKSKMSDQNLSDNLEEIEEIKQRTIINVNAFLENPKILGFLEEEGRKIKEEKGLDQISLSVSPTSSNLLGAGAATSVSPTDSRSVSPTTLEPVSPDDRGLSI